MFKEWEMAILGLLAEGRTEHHAHKAALSGEILAQVETSQAGEL
jgi:hypothetical protein